MFANDDRIRGRKGRDIRRRHFQERPLCVRCEELGKVRLAEELDHIIAIANGGIDSRDPFENRQGLCRECHREKTTEDLGYTKRIRIGVDGWPVEERSALSLQASERRIPSDLTPSLIPLTIVCGPPGSGKSTYIRERSLPDDLVIDLDQIMHSISGLPEHHTQDKWLPQALDERNRILRGLASEGQHKRAWFIVSAPRADDRNRWTRMLGAHMVVLDVPANECIRRINADPTRQGQRERMIKAVVSWWREYKRG